MKKGSREEILDRMEAALGKQEAPDFTSPAAGEYNGLLQPRAEDLSIAFAEKFTAVSGNFSFAANLGEAVRQLHELAGHTGWTKWFCPSPELRTELNRQAWSLGWVDNSTDCHAVITLCEALVAQSGSLVLSAAVSGGRVPSVYAPAHICLAWTHQLVWSISDALDLLHTRYGAELPSAISFATGPSRTADIEKTLVTGVHGPKSVFCFLID